jgi:hypothetical protein
MSHFSWEGTLPHERPNPPTLQEYEECLSVFHNALEDLQCHGIVSDELAAGMRLVLSRALPRGEEGEATSLEHANLQRDLYAAHYKKELEYGRMRDRQIEELEKEVKKLQKGVVRLDGELKAAKAREAELRRELEVRAIATRLSFGVDVEI